MDELNLQVIFRILVQRIRLLIAVAVAGALLACAVTQFFIADTYKSEFEMYVSNYKNLSATQAEGLSSSSLSVSQDLVKEYVVVLNNDLVLSQVADNLQQRGFTMTTNALRNALAISPVNDTAMLRVTAVTTNAKLSQAICQSIADVAPQALLEIMQLSSAKVMAPPREGVKIGPNMTSNMFTGALVAVVITIGVLVLVFCLDTTVRGERDLKRRMDVVVLGEVPSFEMKREGGKRHGKK